MKKKLLALVLVVVLGVSSVVGGTLAYLTDTDDNVNVMTLGNVYIEQNEQQRVEENGEFSSELEEFEQGKKLMPVTYPGNRTDDTIKVGNYEITLGDQEANYIDKIISVTNTGSEPAYVRTLVAVPTGGADWESTPVSANNCWLHWNYPKDTLTYWSLVSTDVPMVEIDGENYYVWEFTHQKAVEADETTYPMVSGFYMDKKVDNDEEGFFITYDDGATKRIDAEEEVKIYALTQAVQIAGFTDATSALDEAFGDVTTTNAEAWFNGMKAPVLVDNAEDLAAALAAGKNAIASSSAYNVFESSEPITMDAKGATVTLTGDNTDATYHGYLGWVAPEVTVKNLNVTGSGFVELGDYNQQGGTKVAENLVITDLVSTVALKDKSQVFTIAPAFMQYGHGTLKNCTMTGTTTLTEGALSFDLGLGQGNNRNDIENKIEGGKYGRVYAWSQSRSTITGAEIDYLQCAPYNGYLTIKAGTHIGTLCIDYDGYAVWGTAANLAKIVIEEGAIVDEIVYKDSMLGLTNGPADWNGQVWNDTLYGTYTQEQWLAGEYKAQ